MNYMNYKDLIYRIVAESPKSKIELTADPMTYCGSDEISTNYTLQINKLKFGEASIYKLEFEGESEKEVFESAYKFIQSRKES